MRYSASVMYGQSLRLEQPTEWCPEPRMRRAWWLWLPRVKWNGGRFTRGEIVAFSFSWLCFWFDVTFSSVRSVREELADLRRRLDVLEGRAPVATSVAKP